MSKLVFTLLISFLIESVHPFNTCADNWTAYEDIKCFKLLDNRQTEEEAVKNCAKLARTSTLAIISSREEQEFIQKLLAEKKESNNLWIGLKFTKSSFEWSDGENASYVNWDRDALKDGSLQCVQMLAKTGKWTDESCRKLAIPICQTKQEFDISLLKSVMEKLDTRLKKLENRTEKELSSMKASSIPLGFIYIQLPNQSHPDQLFHDTKWKNITAQYAGLFFRAEGGSSKAFGKIQQADSPRITNIQTLGGHFESWKIPNYTESVNNSIKQGKWSDELVPGTGYALYSLKIFTTDEENRPINTAIKIWERIE